MVHAGGLADSSVITRFRTACYDAGAARCGAGFTFVVCDTAGMVASSSPRLLSACEAWPFVQDHSVWCSWTSSSSSRQRSWLTTGLRSFVIHPRRFQLWIHVV